MRGQTDRLNCPAELQDLDRLLPSEQTVREQCAEKVRAVARECGYHHALPDGTTESVVISSHMEPNCAPLALWAHDQCRRDTLEMLHQIGMLAETGMLIDALQQYLYAHGYCFFEGHWYPPGTHRQDKPHRGATPVTIRS